MKPRSNKLIVCAVAVFGIAVLIAAGFALRPVIVEQWYLWQLESEDEQERMLAVEELGEMGSVRAVPRLIQEFPRYVKTGYSTKALTKIGVPAVPAARRA